jgi:hypothetical protein
MATAQPVHEDRLNPRAIVRQDKAHITRAWQFQRHCDRGFIVDGLDSDEAGLRRTVIAADPGWLGRQGRCGETEQDGKSGEA